MNIKAIALTALTALTLGVAAPKAEAQTCLTLGNGQLCNTYEYSNRHGQVYNVGYANGNESLSVKVLCNGRNMIEWEGKKRNMTEGQARWVATEFCALPNS